MIDLSESNPYVVIWLGGTALLVFLHVAFAFRINFIMNKGKLRDLSIEQGADLFAFTMLLYAMWSFILLVGALSYGMLLIQKLFGWED